MVNLIIACFIGAVCGFIGFVICDIHKDRKTLKNGGAL